jgi:UDPglucose 6-dehydrogenase
VIIAVVLEANIVKLNSLNVTIVGTGYVGLTTGICLAYLGHKVTCIDLNIAIIERLKRGEVTIHEPGLATMLRIAEANIAFSTELRDGVNCADVVMIAVGTPSKSNGDADINAVEAVAEQIGMILSSDRKIIVVNKSTVPVGSVRRVATIIYNRLQARNIHAFVHVVSNPEFLREGVAIQDTLYPDRIVVGSESQEGSNVLQQLYAPILSQSFNPPVGLPRPSNYCLPSLIATSPTSAELIKYTANAFLAMKISFTNEIAGIAEKVGADIKEVAKGIGLDKRIGTRYLDAGLGWGGSCFGKDTKAMLYLAEQYGQPADLIDATIKVNYRQRLIVVEKLQSILKVVRGHTIGIMGLAFKPQTDDLRDAPSIAIINKLLDLGASVRIHDPVALENFRKQFLNSPVTCVEDIDELAINCDALILVTEWQEYTTIRWNKIGQTMKKRIIIDGRNCLNKELLIANGFEYYGMGR